MSRIPDLVCATSISEGDTLAGALDEGGKRRWVPMRPLGSKCWNWWAIKKRFKLAWMVFTGKADALTWEV